MAASLDRFRVQHFSDLSEERQGVLGATQRLKLQHDSMEFFGARADQPIETCLQEVRASDILVVIVGHRYGSVVPDLGISYSEAEYTEAYRLKKPCLVYKVLAAGRRIGSKDDIRTCFKTAVDNIKPTDAMIVGMYQQFGDQVGENAAFVRELTAGAGSR